MLITKIWAKTLVLLGTLCLILTGCTNMTRLEKDACNTTSPSATNGAAEERKNWNDLDSFACYYGGLTEPAESVPVFGNNQRIALTALKDFDVAILHSAQLLNDAQAEKHIKELQEAGTWVIAYLSIGEDESPHVADGCGENGYASYYIYENGIPKQNTSSGSYFVDAGNKVWQDIVLLDAKRIMDLGVDGLFLDTLDTVDIFSNTADGMVDLVKRLRNELPAGTKLVPNRGFAVFPRISQYVDGIMFESFLTTYDGDLGRFMRRNESDMEYNRTVARNIVNRVRQDDYMPVFCLEYVNREEYAAMLQDVYDAAWAYDFIPYATYSRSLDVCPSPDVVPHVTQPIDDSVTAKLLRDD